MTNTTITQADREAAAEFTHGYVYRDQVLRGDGDHSALVQAFAHHAEQARLSEREKLEDEIDRYTEALYKIVQWADAYPLTVFPEPDFAVCAAALKQVGQTLDAVSASNMRHVVEGCGGIARAAISKGDFTSSAIEHLEE